MVERRIKKSATEGFRYFETDWYKEIKGENDRFINKVAIISVLSGMISSALLMLYSVMFEKGVLFYNYLTATVFTIILMGFVLKIKDVRVKSNLIIITAILGFVSTQILPGGRELDRLIFLIFPIIAVQIEGVKRGTVWTMLFWGVATIVTMMFKLDLWLKIFDNFLDSSIFWSVIIAVIIFILIFYWERQHEKFFDRLVKKIMYDDTTGMPNKKVLINSISDVKESVIVIVRVENFSELTSVFGYELSENITKFAGDKIRESEDGYGYRAFYLKSDEFALYFNENKLEENEIVKVMDAILKELHQGKMTWRYMDIRVSFRMGVSVVRVGEKKDALSNADIALKSGRRNGSSINIYRTHGDEKKKAINAMLKFNELLENKENQSFKAVFQPIVDTESHEIVCYEALMRIKNKNGEYETIYNYLEIAKTTGFYENITFFMLEEACRAILKTGKNISINISIKDIMNKKFEERIKSAADIIKNSQGRIILEILENEEIYEVEKCIEFLKYAKEIGYIIAIDDFGSGYSNFSNLIKLPIDIVKIDGEIIRRLCDDKKAYIILEGILTVCKKANKKSVAEFVENEEIMRAVKKLGVDFSQGYYFGKPEDLNEIRR